MRLRRNKPTDDGTRMHIGIESNASYIPETLWWFLVAAGAAHFLMRILDQPGWIAWPVASLYLVDELRRARNEHMKLATKWNSLLDDWLEHERRVYEQRQAELRREQASDTDLT